MDLSQFIQCIKYVIDYKYLLKDIECEYKDFDDFDILQNKQWIEQQIEWREMRKKRGRTSEKLKTDKDETQKQNMYENEHEDQKEITNDDNKFEMLMDLKQDNCITIPNLTSI